jgi:hypothetical protein
MPNIGGGAVRTTEGSRPGKRGRPKGSRNKSKSLIPANAGANLLRHMQEQLSPEQFEYLKGVVADGKPIQTKDEIDTLIALLSRNLYPALIGEMLPEEEGGSGGVYRKDVTDRLKIVQGLLNLRHQIDKRDVPEDDKSDTILTITGKRGFDIERLAILVGRPADRLDGSDNGVGEQADPIRAVPDQVLERPLYLENREQGPTDRVLDGDFDGGGALGDDSPELQG